MLRERKGSPVLSEFLNYLASLSVAGEDRLPPLSVLSEQLGISTALLREQLEVARALGVVEVRPRTGIKRLPYSFTPAVRTSLAFANEVDPDHFITFSDLRNHIEASYFHQAVSRLTPADHTYLEGIILRAQAKLHGEPVQIPHDEHRKLHLSIYKRLENPFVQGILETYWDLYELVGLNVYTDYAYLERVWQYHQKMVDAIVRGDAAGGYTALVEHMDLIHIRTQEKSL